MSQIDWTDSSTTPEGSEHRSSSSWRHYPWGTQVEFEGYKATFPARNGRVYGQINNAVRFKSGDLLFNVHPDNICYLFSQEIKRFTYVFELNWGPGTLLWSVAPDRNGNVFCTLSGIRTGTSITDAAFGNWGGIVVVNPRKHLLKTIAERGEIVDPYSIQVRPDGKLVIADFADFGGSGRIYSVDSVTGSIEILARGKYLLDPTCAFIDGENVLWIANGDQENQDGEIIALDLSTGERKTVYPREGNMSGALLGVYPVDDDYIIATKNEWDQRTHSAVILINKKTGEAEKLLQATNESPQFFSNIGSVLGTRLFTAECCNRELIEFDLRERKVIHRYDLSPIMHGHLGMRNSFDAISGVYAIP
ncbi:MAG TPA: hypothetical protein VF088_14745 [Pyrinomonadaceae bacterium]